MERRNLKRVSDWIRHEIKVNLYAIEKTEERANKIIAAGYPTMETTPEHILQLARAAKMLLALRDELPGYDKLT